MSFLVLYALPNDPAQLLAGPDATDITPEQLDAIRAQFGLDKPLIVQYVDQLLRLLRGDLGTSIVSGRPVTDILEEAIAPQFYHVPVHEFTTIVGTQKTVSGFELGADSRLDTLVDAAKQAG